MMWAYWNEFLEIHFGQYRWCRRLRCGKWECYWVEPVSGMVWFKVDNFADQKLKASKISGYRPDTSDYINPYWWDYKPSPICRGEPKKEDWG